MEVYWSCGMDGGLVAMNHISQLRAAALRRWRDSTMSAIVILMAITN